MQAEPHPDLTAEPVPEELVAEVEVVDGLPVLSGADGAGPGHERGLVRVSTALPAVQTVAAAATGFVVGAATLALLRRRDARRLSRELRELRGRVETPRRPAEPAPEPTQSYLVHVRVFGHPPVDPRER